MMKMCHCGCGEPVRLAGNTYVNGHYWNGRIRSADDRLAISKGHKGLKYNITIEGRKVRQENGRRSCRLMRKMGVNGWPKGVKPSIAHRCKNSRGVLRAVVEGRFNPRANIVRFIENSDGTEPYWQSRAHRGTAGKFFSRKMKRWLYYDSLWELHRMQLFDTDASVDSYRRQPVRIPYSLNGKTRYFVPDFDVVYKDGSQVLEEIKPEPFLKLPITLAKFKAARLFCKGSGQTFRVVSTLEACQKAA